MNRITVLTGSVALCLASSLSLSHASTTGADSWPSWRGPNADGTAPAANPPTEWSEEKNVKWKTKIPGLGTSTPIVLGNQVFVVTAIPGESVAPAPAPAAPAAEATPPAGEQGGRRRRGGGGGRSEKPSVNHKFAVMSMDRATGKILWQTTVREEVPHEGHHRDHGYASASPVTDGTHLFASFGSRGIYCLDLAGKVIWEKDLGDMQTRNGFGEGASPALHGNTLVVNWDHEGDDFVVALDKRDGKELWRQKRDEATSWATPLIVEHEGKPQVIISASNRIRSYDLANGEQIWECAGMTGNVIPTPFPGEKGVVYFASGFRGASLMAIKLGGKGDITGTDSILWQHTKNTPYVPTPVLHKGRIYFFSGNNGTLSIVEAATGKPLVEAHRVEGLLGGVYASPVAVADRIYLVGRDGKAVVIKASDQVETLATNALDDKFDASAAAVGNQLFLRGHENLYCIAE